jgi:acyl phosphate:glycerol-3-phosphate acyltransferase
MNAILRSLHVLALGLWFGSVAFFTVAGVLLFEGFAAQASLEPDDHQRSIAMPVPKGFDKPRLHPIFPEPMRLEQGSRLAGIAVGSIFPTYFAIQTACALLALLTGVIFARTIGASRLVRAHLIVLTLGLVFVLIGWGLERYVEALRLPRNMSFDQLLLTASPSEQQIQAAVSARMTFGLWHGVSLLVNFVVLILATVALALAANLPNQKKALDSAPLLAQDLQFSNPI